MRGMGPLHAQCVLSPFAEQVVDTLGACTARRVAVFEGSNTIAAAELRRRGALPVAVGEPADMAVALGTLALGEDCDTAWRRICGSAGGAVAVLQFTQDSAHEALTASALRTVGAAPAAWRTAVPDAAARRLVADVVRFDSVQQFCLAMIDADVEVSLDAATRARVLRELALLLARFTLADGGIRFRVEALVLSRD